MEKRNESPFQESGNSLWYELLASPNMASVCQSSDFGRRGSFLGSGMDETQGSRSSVDGSPFESTPYVGSPPNVGKPTYRTTGSVSSPSSRSVSTSTAPLKLPDFRPHPLLRGGHLQTIWSALLNESHDKYQAEQWRITLNDDDEQLVLHDDCPETWEPGSPCVLLLHGLGGSYASSYMVRITEKLIARGRRVFRMDMRGCGAGDGLAHSPGHAGRSEDVRSCVARIRTICPESPLRVAGFSMGGNLLLKMLGERLHESGTVESAFAVSPPIDLLVCSDNLRRFPLYDYAFRASLVRQIRERRQRVPQLRAINLRPLPRSIREFDDRITAPLSGFADAVDYYRQTSSVSVLCKIDVPTTILVADDDPLIPIHMFDRSDFPDCVHVVRTRHGGHLGFIGAQGSDPDRRWLDWRVVDWACAGS